MLPGVVTAKGCLETETGGKVYGRIVCEDWCMEKVIYPGVTIQVEEFQEES